MKKMISGERRDFKRALRREKVIKIERGTLVRGGVESSKGGKKKERRKPRRPQDVEMLREVGASRPRGI